VKKGYVGIHSSGFNDFLLKPELSQVSACLQLLLRNWLSRVWCLHGVQDSSLVGITGLLVPAQAIKDCGFEHPSEGDCMLLWHRKPGRLPAQHVLC
jgi:hypothetical protein